MIVTINSIEQALKRVAEDVGYSARACFYPDECAVLLVELDTLRKQNADLDKKMRKWKKRAKRLQDGGK